MSDPQSRPIYLSKADVTELEAEAVRQAVLGGWVAPLGPEVDGFEADICDYTGVENAVALASGTAGLQMGLKSLGIQPGDEVLMPTLTFAATPFAAIHAGATPVFLDVETASWNLDPDLLSRTLTEKAKRGRLPSAVIVVDLLGKTADYDSLVPLCAEYEIPILVDAAESLGARHGSVSAGSMGDAAVFSFNGNKIMTTSGGGMLVSHDREIVDKVRYWSTQAREPLPWYEHREIGFNYRMSNLLAALGRAQLQRLPEMLSRRKAIRHLYEDLLCDVRGLEVMGDPPWGRGNNWLTCLRIDQTVYGVTTVELQQRMAKEGIEVRPVWKPMHRQPVFAATEAHLSGTADEVFTRCLCLPSGAGLVDDEIVRVAHSLRECL